MLVMELTDDGVCEGVIDVVCGQQCKKTCESADTERRECRILFAEQRSKRQLLRPGELVGKRNWHAYLS